jgi:hypothetical protein
LLTLDEQSKLTLKVKIPTTTSYRENDFLPTNPSLISIKKWPYNGHYSLFIMIAISADPSL